VRRREDDWGDPALVYDEEHDLFRFRDGKFAFSREWANWPLLRKRGRMMEELPKQSRRPRWRPILGG
jgi:hypothetical protein